MYYFLNWKHLLNGNEVFVLLTECAPRISNRGRHTAGIRQCVFSHNTEGIICQPVREPKSLGNSGHIDCPSLFLRMAVGS